MRLHLPKTLLAAVLAACAALPAGATITETTLTSLTVQGATLPTAPEGQTTVYKQIVTNDKDSCDTLSTATATFLKSNGNAAEDQRFKVTSAATVENAGTLVIAESTVSGETTNAGQLYLSRWSGSYIDNELNITNDIIIGKSNAGSAIRLSDANTDDRIITLSGTITLAQDAQIGVDSNVTSGHARITGSVSGSQKTLTIAAGDSGSGVLNMGDGTSGKSLVLGGLKIADGTSVILNYSSAELGTLTLNSTSTSAALTLTGSGTTTVDSLVTGGSVLDASGLEGTLTINGAKWTGNLSTATENVLIAKDDTTASNLVTSMNETHGISYVFRAEGNVVKRDLRTEAYTLDAFINNNRIVVVSDNDKKTYGDKEFSKVGLSDLRTNDKVTIDGLTGWIGDASSNNIWADLVFENTTSINNGSSAAGQNIIYYHGAISGDGTLSFDWSGKTNNYIFNGDLSRFNGKIKDDATLNVTIGGTLAEGVSNAVNATIDIAGALTVNREASFTQAITVGGALTVNREASFTKAITVGGKLIVKADSSIAGGTVTGNMDLKSGALTINGNVTLNGELDMKGGESTGGACLGHVVISETGKLKVNGKMWVLANSAKILLKEGGSLEWNGLTFTGQAEKADVDTGLTFGSNAQLSLTDAHFATNASIAFSGTGEKTLSWTLAGCSIDVRNGTLNVNGSNTNTALSVSSGSVVFTSSTSLTDSTVSGGNLKFNGSQTTLNGTLTISGGVAENTATGDNEEIRLGTAGKVSIVSGSLINDGFTYRNNGADASITGNGQNTLKVYEGSVVLKDVVMEKTVSAGKGIGIALDNVTLVLKQNTGITTLRDDGKKTQKLSGVSVASGATLKVENSKASLGVVSGTGTVSTSVDNEFSLALKADGTGSTFSGTLEATAGTMKVTGVGELAMGEYSMPHVMTALKAAGGNVDLMNTPLVSITEMVIGENATVGVYGGTTASEENEGGVYVHGVDASTKGALTVESGATLKSDLQLVNTVLTFNGSLTMGSDLTLYSGNELAGSLYTSWDKKSALTLFTGVDNLTIGTEVAVADKEYKASEVFSNIGNDYSLKMTGSTGDYIVQLVQSTPAPEPTTATLSLLALMGLAARRRRRKA